MNAILTLLLALLLPACSRGPAAAPRPGACDPHAPPTEQRAACDDGDACTADRCAPSGLCAYSAVGQCGGA